MPLEVLIYGTSPHLELGSPWLPACKVPVLVVVGHLINDLHACGQVAGTVFPFFPLLLCTE